MTRTRGREASALLPRVQLRPADSGGRAPLLGADASTRASYQRHHLKLIAHVERRQIDANVRDVTTDDCREFLDGWLDASPSTVCSIHSALNGFFGWLYIEQKVDANPMDRIARPRRPRPEDVDVVIVTWRQSET